jgi:hypothetical protein
MGDTEEDVERRSDELEAVEAIYPTEFKLLTDFREVTGSGDGDGAGKSTVVEFSLSMGLGLQSSAESGPPSEPGMLILTFALPSGEFQFGRGLPFFRMSSSTPLQETLRLNH